MTEEDARTKWCPMARMAASGNPEPGNIAVNRWSQDSHEQDPRCIASDCAMWRWRIEPQSEEEKGVLPGFCGLAGTPMKYQ